MAKDNREIRRAVVLGGTTYTTGMEDELGKALKPEQVQRLTERGALFGFTANEKETNKTETKETNKEK